ncbi:ubiquitin-conjugating enzyme family protein [Artemisia annua]|uniref:Ubiquitin-conjugating enzyme family protein n=1 Tax=Artemisia annua TaxID=35608 RepID=A0A2U1N0B1_ARTAN|nr:ubiquitin-conjugating enzyme family protein [Artemisia annua]
MLVSGDQSLKSVSKLKKKGKRKKEKREFPGSSSSSMGPELIETADAVPGDRMPKLVSKSKRKGKRKKGMSSLLGVVVEVPIHEIIKGKSKSNKKMKGDIGISLGSGSSTQSDSEKDVPVAPGHFPEGFTPAHVHSLPDLVQDMKKKARANPSATSHPSPKGSSIVRNSSSMRKIGNEEGMKKYENFKKFDTVVDHSDHFYSNQNSAMKQPPKDWAKKIQGEWKILKKRLACTYPPDPPLVYYHSGGLHINPNLYKSGKICLSLLNTWNGGAKERWIPGTSTMLQVLVSIQGLILNTKPYFNEPGYASSSGTAQGKKYALDYNENTLILSLKTMVYTMKKQPKYFEDLVVGHFRYRVRDILMACKAYSEGVQVGSLMREGVQDMDEGEASCSYKFKTNMVSYIQVLIDAFRSIKEAEDFLFLSQKNILN